ncbi:MAG: hypothetical protein Q8K98_05170 [Bacteroidota bacterium]|nr:hypothetical protein [Bacteroidota bacterium]
MTFTDFKSRFINQYKGDIKDPILTTILQTLEAYQEEVQDQLLLSTYAQRSDQVSDGLFEVLRRHLFGQMFPGPAYVVLQSTLREVKTAQPVLLEQAHYFNVQDKEGAKVLFAPQYPTWIVPANTNDVRVDSYGDDLMLGFSIFTSNLQEIENGEVSIFTGDIDPLLAERLRCRITQTTGFKVIENRRKSVIRTKYPGNYNIIDDFFLTPYDSRFIKIPFDIFIAASSSRGKDDLIWIPFPGLGEFAQELEKKPTLNSFLTWNMVEMESLAMPVDQFRYNIPITAHKLKETIITSVTDLGADPPIEYINASTVLDPGYPFQYTTSVDIHKDEIVLAFSPPPSGTVKVQYCQYDIGDECINIASGRSFGLYQGIDERVKSAQSITPTHRIESLNNKEYIWNYFRSLLASRQRWLTKDDLRAAIIGYPPFSHQSDLVKSNDISFEEKVGRVKGFLTPFTEIKIPVNDGGLLDEPDKSYFEQQIGSYIRAKTVNGNFIRINLVSAEE